MPITVHAYTSLENDEVRSQLERLYDTSPEFSDGADAMEQLAVPIICRCTKNQIVLDVRTKDREDYQTIFQELKMIQSGQQMECL